MPLTEIARRLGSPEIMRVAAGFEESRASVRRALMMLGVTLWAVFCEIHIPGAGKEGYVHPVPLAATMLVATVIWGILARSKENANAKWLEVVGTSADFAGIALLLANSWDMMFPLVGALPLTCVTVGARFDKAAFYGAIVASVTIVFAAAPAGYWDGRPAMAMLTFILVVGIPITFNRLLTSLRSISRRAIDARDAQGRFLAMVSHELRTPLNSVLNAAQLISVYRDSEEREQLRNTIITNASVLLGRINDVLDISSARYQEMQLADDVFSLQTVLDTARAVITPVAEQKRIMLTIQSEGDDRALLRGDARRIEQVITNLAGNAIKYTGEGGAVSIGAMLSMEGQESGQIQIRIVDTGSGIPKEQRAVVFEPFQRVAMEGKQRTGGVGLGLYIVKLINERMGGTLEILDNPGGGTVFAWDIPIQRAEEGAQEQAMATVQESLTQHRMNSQPCRCLVVDDSASNRDILRRTLELAGHGADMAMDGTTGLSLFATREYDVAFIDLNMPDMSGTEMVRAMRNTATGKLPAIIMLTAATDKASANEIAAAGINDILYKPLSIPKLLALLDNIRSEGKKPKGGIQTVMESEVVRELRQDGSINAVRAMLHSSRVEIETAASEWEAAYDDNVTDIVRIKDTTHRLKEALLAAGVPPTALEAAGFRWDGRQGGAESAADREATNSLVRSTLAALQAEPEF